MSISEADAVRALSLACFGVEPDSVQLEAMIVEIDGDPLKLEAVARRMGEFRLKMDRIHHRRLPDHSQYGEFAMLLRELVTAGRSHGIIVDVGANGRAGSNSYDLLTDYGWKALLIEANPHLVSRIRSEFGNAAYDLVCCAIGITPGSKTLHLGIDDQISSLRSERVANWGAVTGSVDVTVRRLPDVLDENRIPRDFDILSLDIEDADADVFNDLVSTSSYRPRWVVIETALELDKTTLASSAFSAQVRGLYDLADRTLPNLVLRRIGL